MPLKPSIAPSTLAGNARHSAMSEAPKRTATASFAAPRKRMEPLVRAPNRYWPARPPAPWHIGIAPNHAPTRFISPTETATFLGDAGRSGKRSTESAQTAMTELSVVSGIWGSAAFGKAVTNAGHVGGDHRGSDSPRWSDWAIPGVFQSASASPTAKRARADGIRLEENSARITRAAAAPVT